MSEPTPTWGLISSMRQGVASLFPTRKTKLAMWGLIGLGVATTFMELMAAQLFSGLITNIDTQSAQRSAVLLGAFIVAFSGVKGVQYFQSVYRLTIFEKSLRKITFSSRAAESWRWPMAISLVGMLGQVARLLVVTLTVMATAWAYGLLLLLCSLLAMLIVDRTGRKQYEIHHGFEAAKKAGNPPTAAERIGTRIRAGERAGLAAAIPVVVFVVALGAGAVNGWVPAQSALVLFIAGRMAANMYGTLASSTMRYIRAEVNVEAYGAAQATSTPTTGGGALTDDDLLEALALGGYLRVPPGQAFARLIDEGRYLGDVTDIGRIARAQRFSAVMSKRGDSRAVRAVKFVAAAPNQVWCHDVYALPLAERQPPAVLQIVLDAYSRAIVGWRIDPAATDAAVMSMLVETLGAEGVESTDVELLSARAVIEPYPSVHDMLRDLGVMRTLSWTGPEFEGLAPYDGGPEIPAVFDSAADCTAWVDRFVTWYNTAYYQPDVGYLHPCDVHAGLAEAITTQRRGTLETLFEGAAHPFRSGLPDTWRPPEEVVVQQLAITTVPQEFADSEARAFEEDDEL